MVVLLQEFHPLSEALLRMNQWKERERDHPWLGRPWRARGKVKGRREDIGRVLKLFCLVLPGFYSLHLRTLSSINSSHNYLVNQSVSSLYGIKTLQRIKKSLHINHTKVKILKLVHIISFKVGKWHTSFQIFNLTFRVLTFWSQEFKIINNCPFCILNLGFQTWRSLKWKILLIYCML